MVNVDLFMWLYREKPKEISAFPAAGDGAGLAEIKVLAYTFFFQALLKHFIRAVVLFFNLLLKSSDSFSSKRVYLTDLALTKTIKGKDVQVRHNCLIEIIIAQTIKYFKTFVYLAFFFFFLRLLFLSFTTPVGFLYSLKALR